jgi:hypothetical protein
MAKIRIDAPSKNQHLLLLYADSGTLYLTNSDDEGKTWAVATAIATADFGDFCVARNGLRYFFWVESGAIKGKIYDAVMNVVKGSYIAIASGVDDAGIAVKDFMTGGSKWGIGIQYESSGVQTYVTSDDGVNFS